MVVPEVVEPAVSAVPDEPTRQPLHPERGEQYERELTWDVAWKTLDRELENDRG